jgi:3-polyprenyl-4-hydroxybenzoate decarboxylase
MNERLKPRKDLAAAPQSQHRVSHEDLRDLIRDFEAMRELKVIEGADPHLEISALAETLTMRFPGEEPALLFDKIKGSFRAGPIPSAGWRMSTAFRLPRRRSTS